MDKHMMKFGNIETEKQKFYQLKRVISIEDINISKMILPNKVSFGEKCFKYFIKNSIKKEFNNELAYNGKYLKVKIKSCQIKRSRL